MQMNTVGDRDVRETAMSYKGERMFTGKDNERLVFLGFDRR